VTAPDAHTRGTRTSDYDFELPAAQIAQFPLAKRDASRLLTVNRATGAIAHRMFSELPSIIAPGDALVLNTTKVMRARLLGARDSGAPAEILLLRALTDGTWEAMVSPGGKLRPGRRVHIADGFDVEIVSLTDRRTRIVRLHAEGDVSAAIERHGHIPLPPYIARADTTADAERYQTVYARENGSVAAPTAGLHVTDALLAELDARGVRRVDVLLHVGAGTFKPVEVEDPALHPMHEERYELSAESARSHPRNGQQDLGAGHHERAGARECRSRGRDVRRGARGDATLRSPSLYFSRHRQIDHEFPSSALDAADAGRRACRLRSHDARVWGGG
jgi:S-adenosylmethionine:tRNA ribosyltransferase-isomerase